MPRTSSGLFALAAMLWIGCCLGARAQVAPRSPAQELTAARQALDAVLKTSLSATDARRIGEIKRDFDDLVAAFTAQSQPGQDGADVPELGESWRLKLGIVNSDLRGATDLDQGTRALMDQFSARLDAFYAAAIGLGTADAGAQPAGSAQTTAPTSARATASGGTGGANALAVLDRMQTTVAGLLARSATAEPQGAGADVTVSRATLDELQSDIARLRMLAQSGAPLGAR